MRTLLVSGRPAELQMQFAGVASSTTMITRMDVECWESEQETNFTVRFRNIPLKN